MWVLLVASCVLRDAGQSILYSALPSPLTMFIKHGWPQTSLGLGSLRLAPGQVGSE